MRLLLLLSLVLIGCKHSEPPKTYYIEKVTLPLKVNEGDRIINKYGVILTMPETFTITIFSDDMKEAKR